MAPPLKVIGVRFGNLVGIERAERNVSKNRNYHWKLKCDCGNIIVSSTGNLSNGHTKSCGCLRQEIQRDNIRHGATRRDTPIWTEYRIYTNMKTRCYNPKNKFFNRYGGRGIIMCDRWLEKNGEGFKNFLVDMGRRPSMELSIDRINNDGNYELSNCRWATQLEQIHNRG